MLKIEKRLPFGFKGEWGQVYKIYTPTQETGESPAIIRWQNASYADIGQDVQFKHPEEGFEKEYAYSQSVANLINLGEFRQEKTTDAFFDEKTKGYKCVVEIGDIVCLSGEYYVCESIKVKNIVTPNEQSFFYLGLKKIYDVILKGVANA